MLRWCITELSASKVFNFLVLIVEEEGLNLLKLFCTAEMTQERGAQGDVHDFHANYFKSGQHGHTHVSRFKDDKGVQEF